MLTVRRDLEPSLILSIALIASCLSMPESPEPALDTTAQAEQDVTLSPAEQDAQDIREADFVRALRASQSNSPDVSVGGHCNVRLFDCDPYPIGKGKHRRADAYCSSVSRYHRPLSGLLDGRDRVLLRTPGSGLPRRVGRGASRQALHAVR